MQIAIVLFGPLTALDAVGPYEVSSRFPGPRSCSPPSALGCTAPTPGCSGSTPTLAAAGFLRGRRATTHWLALDELADHGATPTNERVVADGKYVTAAGVSAGIDLALTLAEQVGGAGLARMIPLGIEYDPQPRTTQVRLPRRRRPPARPSRRGATSSCVGGIAPLHGRGLEAPIMPGTSMDDVLLVNLSEIRPSTPMRLPRLRLRSESVCRLGTPRTWNDSAPALSDRHSTGET